MATKDRTTAVRLSVRKMGRERISAFTRHRLANTRLRLRITQATAVAVTTLVVVATKTIAIATRHDETVVEVVVRRQLATTDEDAKRVGNHSFDSLRLYLHKCMHIWE